MNPKYFRLFCLLALCLALIPAFLVPAEAEALTATETICWSVVSAGNDQILYLGSAPHIPAAGEATTESGRFVSTEPTLPYSSYSAAITKVVVESEIRPTSCQSWFSGFVSCTQMDLEKLDTQSVTTMNAMFRNCYSLTALDVSNFSTGNVTDLRSMFAYCHSLAELNVSGFDTSKVTDMSLMFVGCNDLAELDVSNFNTQAVTSMRLMFKSCSSLTTLDLSNFDTGNVTDMYYMFDTGPALTYLNLSGFTIGQGVDTTHFLPDYEPGLLNIITPKDNRAAITLSRTYIDLEGNACIQLPAASMMLCRKYTITVNLDGGTGAANQNFYAARLDQAQTIPLAAPRKDGYVFDGWAISGSNAEATANNHTLTIPAGAHGNITLTALWRGDPSAELDGTSVITKHLTGNALVIVAWYDGQQMIGSHVTTVSGSGTHALTNFVPDSQYTYRVFLLDPDTHVPLC